MSETSSKKILIAVYVLGLILCSSLATELLLYSQNLLVNKGWIASKRTMELTLMRSHAFLMTRFVVAGNELDLGAWYGFQEILSKQSYLPQDLKFKFQLGKDGYLDFIYNGSDQGSSGIRISRRRDLSSHYFESNSLRQFIRSYTFLNPIDDNDWHTASIFSSSNGLRLQIDDSLPIALDSYSFKRGRIGFRAGIKGAKIDDIEAWRDGEKIFTETFRNTHAGLRALLFNFLVITLLFEIIFLVVYGAKFCWKTPCLQMKILFSYVFLAILILLFSFDFYFWSRKGFVPEYVFKNEKTVPSHVVESIRHSITDTWAKMAGAYVDAEGEMRRANYTTANHFLGPFFCSFPGNVCQASSSVSAFSKNKKCKLITFLGTSQTVGAGAENFEKTFYSIIQRELNHTLRPTCVETLNLSRSGVELPILEFHFHESTKLGFIPNILIVNLSNNDNKELLESRLPDLVLSAQRLGAKVILLKEANSTEAESYLASLNQKHQILQKVGLETNVKVFDLHRYLADPKNVSSGILWWDFVHLTSFGQKLVADWLKPKILEQL